MSTRGLQWKSERGYQRNPSTILAYQLRQQLKIYTSELGLSPASRGRLSSAGDDLDDDSGFD